MGTILQRHGFDRVSKCINCSCNELKANGYDCAEVMIAQLSQISSASIKARMKFFLTRHAETAWKGI